MIIFVHVQYALTFTSVSLDDLIVHLYDFSDSTHLEGYVVLLCKFLDHMPQLRIIVSGHRREQMMLELVLHTSE
jgi:hypothetical protein